MISNLSIIFMIISLLMVLLFPIGLWIYFYKKERISAIAVLVGALTFFVSQIVLRMPLLQFLQGQNWYASIANDPKNIWITALFLGLTAGVFEEVGRFLGFKFFLKKKLEWKNGIAFGIGHGGIEAIILVGLTYINNIIFSIMINSGAFDKISGTLAPGTSDFIKGALANTSSILFLVGGIERIFAIIAHIAFSVMVLYGVKYRKGAFLIYAILAHALLDTPSVIINYYLGTWATEAYVLIFTVAALIFIIRSKKLYIEHLVKAENIL